jgi:hypothetical protein
MSPGARIDYKTLRQINPEAARKAVLEYLKTNGGNKAEAARVFRVNRTVVYKQEKEIFKIGPRHPKISQTRHRLRLSKK